jgi:hypothetical protein
MLQLCRFRGDDFGFPDFTMQSTPNFNDFGILHQDKDSGADGNAKKTG